MHQIDFSIGFVVHETLYVHNAWK